MAAPTWRMFTVPHASVPIKLTMQASRAPLGAVIAKRMRQAIWDRLGMTCSAGVSYNKVMQIVIRDATHRRDMRRP